MQKQKAELTAWPFVRSSETENSETQHPYSAAAELSSGFWFQIPISLKACYFTFYFVFFEAWAERYITNSVCNLVRVVPA